MEYLWVINGERELSEVLASVDLSCIPYTDYYSYATRAWHPDDCAPDDYEDYDPNEDGCGFIDLYGGCWEDDDQEVPDNATYLGEFEGHEYYVINEYVSWSDANDVAQNAGGYLATISSPEENEFVRSSIESNLGSGDAVWFGLVDIMSDGTGWSWITGEPLDYTNWAAGEPNGPGQEDCGEFYNSGEWNDTHCDGMLPHVVEFGDVEEPEEPTITSYTYSCLLYTSPSPRD